VLDGQKQESRLKLAGSTERLGYCEGGWSVTVAVVIVVAASETVRLKFTLWDPSEAGDEEVAVICWMSSSRSETRSTSMITGDALLSNIDDVSVGRSLLADADGNFELGDSAGRIAIARDEPKKESILR
jgi:hypothetical protein